MPANGIAAATLTVHAADPAGREAILLVFWPLDAAGRVRYREWTHEAWLAPGRDGDVPAGEMLDRVRGLATRGWKLSEPASRIEAWLASA